MWTELKGKAGCLCQPAKEGKLRCPLIVRPTSENVITGNLFQALNVLNPFWWVSDLLNHALGYQRFRRQVYRKFKIVLWHNRPYFPRELLPWPEGSTQVDCTITWENPPTSIFFEMKYGADLSPKTAGDNGEHGFPSDQLIRNARVGLLETGWFQQERLFDFVPRDFSLLLIGPDKGNRLVKRYRDSKKLLKAIPHSDRLPHLPQTPFIGELSFPDIIGVLAKQGRWFTRPERRVVEDLTSYLDYKQSRVPPKWTGWRHGRREEGRQSLGDDLQ
jgi:hypothetical protein